MPRDSVPQMFEYGFQHHESAAGFVAFAKHYMPFLHNLNPGCQAAAPEGATGKVFGFVYSGLDFGGALAPLLFGWLMDDGQYRGVFLGIAVMYLICVVSVLHLKQGRGDERRKTVPRRGPGSGRHRGNAARQSPAPCPRFSRVNAPGI